LKQVVSLLFVGILGAAGQNVLFPVSPSASDPPPDPLDLKQKYLYSLNRMVGSSAWLAYATHAELDHAMRKPEVWGDDMSSYAERMASAFGYRLVHENIAFGVRAIAHEDPRYFREGRGSVWGRSRYAIAHTFAVHNDNGSLMPAYSLFISCYATPAIGREWRPGPFTLDRELRGGTVGIGVGVVQSLWREFSPDLRQKLPKRFR
jgi:hypothetical protein